MYFLNLSLGQFLVLFGAVSTVAVALYLLDRSRRRQVVATLRFWTAADQPEAVSRRRRIQQPWSLLLQLLSMALLLLAVAQLRFGGSQATPRDHVIVLETSAWMGARTGNRTLIELARERASQYLHSLPAGDRVMLVRADALTTPATVFETDRSVVEAAILGSRPGATALNLDQALAFARRVQLRRGRRPGEIAFIGTGRVAERDPGADPPPDNLRVIAVPDVAENRGLRKIGARRSPADPDLWDVYVSVRNYGAKARTVSVSLDFAAQPRGLRSAAGSQAVELAPGRDGEATFRYRTGAAGILGVSLTPHDAFPADDRAEVELPSLKVLPVTVYSTNPEALRPVLSANPQIAAVYRRPEEYRGDEQGLVVLDRFAPPQRPAGDSLWIDPPPSGSPVPVRQRVQKVPFLRWDPNHPLAAGLRTKDLRLLAASVFEAAPGDVVVGEVAAGPVIVARPGKYKTVVLGFHPALSGMRYELATPLLFANLERWVSPETFLTREMTAGSVGTVKLELQANLRPEEVNVLGDDGKPLLFTLQGRALHFFAGVPGKVRVRAGDHEYAYSLSLPQLWDAKWEAPAAAHRGMPSWLPSEGLPTDLWPWLALAGGLGLLSEWLLFGRARARLGPSLVTPRRSRTQVAEAVRR